MLLAMVLGCFCGVFAAGDKGVASAEMLRQGDREVDQGRWQEAAELYHRVADTYNVSLPRQQRELCLEAVLGCCDANLRMGKYGDAFEYLLLAEKIIAYDNFPDAKYHRLYGALYLVLASQTNKGSYLDQVITHSRRAFWSALKMGDEETMHRSFGDLSQSVGFKKRFDLIEEEEKSLRHYAAGSKSYLPKLTLFSLETVKAKAGKDYALEAAYFDSALLIVPEVSSTARIRANLFKGRGLARINSRNFPEGMTDEQKALALSYRYNMRDIRLAALYCQAMVYEGLKDSTQQKATMRHVIDLRDSLRSYAIADDVVRLEQVRERREMQTRMDVAEYRAKVYVWAVAAMFVVMAVILSLLVMLRNRNRRLRQHSRLLYERMRELYRDKSRVESRELRADDTDHAIAKYEGSSLGEEDKQEIEAAVRRVLATDAVYSPEISLTSFAALVGWHPKAVSQVIHEVFDCNFPTLVNRQRIVEACRRMDSPQYANWSVEGIAESVGFNSRNTFSTNFRRFTGLGIRAYRQAAKERAGENAEE